MKNSMHDIINESNRLNRRTFLGQSAGGLGALSLSTLLHRTGWAAKGTPNGLPDLPHFAPKAKRVIYLFQSGAPSQIETFDHKPMLHQRHGQELPESIRQGQRLTGMTAG
ncbi:MAG: DUF1501 domain-containing protein, partial [Verrucomicrobia bacterium]|nr:DUF1501 domain-containing protein [Verrucomicrobiota bacterium]